MRTTFSGLEIAKSALFASRSQMNVASHNIANADTVGYTRQRLSTVSLPASTASTFLRIDNSTTAGRGVSGIGVTQIRNTFLDAQFRDLNSSLGESTIMEDEFAKIESLFNTELEDEDTSVGMSSVFGNFYKNLYRLSQDASSSEIRQAVLQSGVAVSDAFNYYYNTLSEQQQNVNDAVSATVESINNLCDQITKLNERIFSYELTGDAANDLRDQRNVLLDQLSQKVNIEYTQTQDNKLIVTLGGKTLIDHTSYNALSAVATKDNEGVVPGSGMLYEVYWQGNGESANVSALSSINGLSDVNFTQTSGAAATANANLALSYSGGTFTLGGLTATSAGFTSGNFADGGQYRIAFTDGTTTQILEFDVGAGKFADQNALGSALGGNSIGIQTGFPGTKASVTSGELSGYLNIRDGNSTSTKGIPAYISKLNSLAQKVVTDFNNVHMQGYTLHDTGNSVKGVKFFEDFNDITKVTAGNMAVRSQIQNDVRYIAASGVEVNQAGQPNTQTGNNENAKKLAALITGTGSIGNFDGAYKSLAVDVGVQMDKLNQNRLTDSLRLDQIDSQRQATSGVSVDEEMTDIIKFSQSYNAAARLITTMDEQLDVLINRMGMVGRS